MLSSTYKLMRDRVSVNSGEQLYWNKPPHTRLLGNGSALENPGKAIPLQSKCWHEQRSGKPGQTIL